MFSLGIALPFERTSQLVFGGQAQDNILRPISGQFSQGNSAPFNYLNEEVTQPDETANGLTQFWEGTAAGTLSPELEFEVPLGPVSILRVWLLCRQTFAVGISAEITTCIININGLTSSEPITPAIQPNADYNWKSFDLTDGWTEITSLLMEVNVNLNDSPRLDIETIYIEAIP